MNEPSTGEQSISEEIDQPKPDVELSQSDEKVHGPAAHAHPTEYVPAQARAARAKALRSTVPRTSHAAWDPPRDRPDPIGLLEAQATTRVPELVPIRYGRMLVSPFAFYRGAAAVMAADLAHTPTSGLRVQLCGDAHLANFGGFGTPERNLIFNINDFDETLPGPFEWDLKRLAASFEVAGRARGFAAKDRSALVLATVGQYRQAMREFAAMGDLAILYSQLTVERVVEQWGADVDAATLKAFEARIAQTRSRDSEHAAAKLTQLVDGRLRIVSQAPLIVPVEELLPEAERASLEEQIRVYLQTYSKSLVSDRRRLLERYRFVQLARKVVGVGSVGTRCGIALMLGRVVEDPLMLQVKEAQASVLEPYAGKSAVANHGQRVVEGQRITQASPDVLLGWDRLQGLDGVTRDFYVRQLWDWKISANLETITPRMLIVYARMCGWTLARAHARSGDRIAIGAYLGGSDVFDQALASFAVAYADQNERDYKALVDAAASGRITARTGI
jgi:uncharacterized protein (DUF2252 family)